MFETGQGFFPFNFPTPFVQKTCNTPTSTLVNVKTISVKIQYEHEVGTLILSIRAKYNTASTTAFFGIRDLNIIISNDIVTNNFCFMSDLAFTGSCGCASGQYKTNSGTCEDCADGCKECFGESTRCASCEDGWSYDGNTCIECDSSCKYCFGTNPNQCYYCKPSKYLYLSNECLDDCLAPFSPNYDNDIQRCEPPCDNGQKYYLKNNNTCSSNCNHPLYTTFIDLNGTKRCDFICNETNNEYLYPNNSCGPVCSESFDIRENQFCECNSPNYTYWNNSCLPSCPFPYSNRTVSGKLVCENPCDTISQTILSWDGNCLSSCISPNISVQDPSGYFDVCISECQYPKYLYYNGH